MGLNQYRNKPCQCGSGMKFKFCCLQDHYKQQAGLVTNLAKKVQEKTTKYFNKQYKAVSNTVCVRCDGVFPTADSKQRICPDCQQGDN